MSLWWPTSPEKTVPSSNVECWPFDPAVLFRESLCGCGVRVDAHLETISSGHVSSSSEKNCEAASCQSFLSFLYFFFPAAPYWQRIDYSFALFLYILSHNAFSSSFSISLIPLSGPLPPPSPGKSPGFPYLSPEFFRPCIPFSLHILLHAANLWEEANKNYREKETPFLL